MYRLSQYAPRAMFPVLALSAALSGGTLPAAQTTAPTARPHNAEASDTTLVPLSLEHYAEFYGELYASSGSVQQGIVEAGQVRMGMGVTPWTDPELYRSQSPLHNVQGITTPFLILHGTADGAVDWRQGLEFFNAARRNGKEVIFLSYPDEAHHLNRRANQEDFQIRMKQFFDHYLLDAPAPRWMTEGVPFIDRDRADPRDGLPGVGR